MVMFRLYEIETSKDVPVSLQKFSPANTLVDFAEYTKTAVFVESLHAEVLAKKNEFKSDSHYDNLFNHDRVHHDVNMKMSRVFVTTTYLPRLSEVLLQLRFGRLPKKLKVSRVADATINPQIREVLCRSKFPLATESSVILKLLPLYIPRVYVEGYKPLLETAKPWNSQRIPRTIFTANRHLYDDVFNYWTALAVEGGSRLVLAQHGGNYGISEFPSFAENHENLIADRYITWGWKTEGPTYTGFALPLIGREFHSSCPNGSLLVLTDQLWKYPRSLFSDMPENSTYLDHLRSALHGLSSEIRQNVLLRLHHAHQDAASSQIDWWNEHAPDIKQDEGGVGFQKRLAESRLILIAHNGTSIPEAIALHAPTVITWSDSYMKVRKSAEDVFDALEVAGVFHRTPESAASFINSIWHDVDGWWNSPATIEARKQFTDQYARTVPNPVRFLAKALQF